MQQQGMPSSGRGQPGFIAPDQGKLLDSIVSLPSAGERKTMLKEQYQLLDNDGIGTVVERAEKEGDVWAEMLEELKSMTTERMLQGRDLLNDMLASGEINILDRKIVENVKAGKIDPAFLQVSLSPIDRLTAKHARIVNLEESCEGDARGLIQDAEP